MNRKTVSGLGLVIAAAFMPTAASAGVIGMLGNFDVTITGDTAKSRTICFNPMVLHTGASEATGKFTAGAVRRKKWRLLSQSQ